MLISRDEEQNLKDMLIEYFDNWTVDGSAEKYAKEYEDDFSPVHERLENTCEGIILEMATILSLDFE